MDSYIGSVRLEKVKERFDKGSVVWAAINSERHKDEIEVCPHKTFFDLSFIVKMRLDDNSEDTFRYTNVTYEMIDKVGIDEEKLFKLADDAKTHAGFWMDDVPMYVMETETKLFGGIEITNTKEMAEVAEKVGYNLFIIPSSIHELILIADDGDFTAKSLMEMIAGGNAQVVKPNEILSDIPYYYNRVTNEVYPANLNK